MDVEALLLLSFSKLNRNSMKYWHCSKAAVPRVPIKQDLEMLSIQQYVTDLRY